MKRPDIAIAWLPIGSRQRSMSVGDPAQTAITVLMNWPTALRQ